MTDVDPMVPFKPLFLARGAHAQTVLGHLLNRPRTPLNTVAHTVVLEDGDKLIMHEDRPDGSPRGAALLLHGLGGDASARYMISTAARLTRHSFVVFRLNHRAAGDGAGLAKRTYHSGLTADVKATLEAIVDLYPGLPLVTVGYSMSGNTLLKYLAEEGPDARLFGGIAVNPPIDLARCVQALETGENRLYHRRFTRLLKNLVKENGRRAKMPPLFETSRARSVREYDAEVTAPTWGFESAEHYYDSESAVRRIHQIEIPAFILTSDDDPVVPVSTFKSVSLPDAVRLYIARGGGHMGYVTGVKTPHGDRRWLEYVIAHVAERFVHIF